MKVLKWKPWIFTILLIVLFVNIPNLARLIYPVQYIDHIKKQAEEYHVDPYLIMSMIKAESNFDKDAVSHRKATGLMQITEPTANWLAQRMGIEDFQYANITDPSINIEMGCYYMAYLLDLYQGDKKNALAAYNAGEGTVGQWLLDEACSKDGKTLTYVPYPETRHYIAQVSNNETIYRLLYNIKPSA
ncbi:MAG: lytic transglycosylase domain-containing protein [Ruminococcaceae bacterium]|nr:lytic transglycosylase domain-containing protein [Oscillospiraceae bacterium]